MTALRSAALLAALAFVLALPRFAQAAGIGKGAIGIGSHVTLGGSGHHSEDTFSGQSNTNGITIGAVGIGARTSLGAVGFSRPETTDTAGRALISGICAGTTVSSNRNARTSIGGRGTTAASPGGIGD